MLKRITYKKRYGDINSYSEMEIGRALIHAEIYNGLFPDKAAPNSLFTNEELKALIDRVQTPEAIAEYNRYHLLRDLIAQRQKPALAALEHINTIINTMYSEYTALLTAENIETILSKALVTKGIIKNDIFSMIDTRRYGEDIYKMIASKWQPRITRAANTAQAYNTFIDLIGKVLHFSQTDALKIDYNYEEMVDNFSAIKTDISDIIKEGKTKDAQIKLEILDTLIVPSFEPNKVLDEHEIDVLTSILSNLSKLDNIENIFIINDILAI